MKNIQVNIRAKLLQLLADVTENEYRDIFSQCETDDEKLRLLTSESMLALVFISSVEDEFSIEFDDDEIDIDFFSSVDLLEEKVKKYLY